MNDEQLSDMHDSTGSTSCCNKNKKLHVIDESKEINFSHSESDSDESKEINFSHSESDSAAEGDYHESDKIVNDCTFNISQSNDGQEENGSLVENESTQGLLCNWAICHKISHVALKGLLCILRECYDPELPGDPCTLCRTPAGISCNIQKICGGEYYHFGLQNALHQFLQVASEAVISDVQSTLLVKISCDGIPLHKSSSKQFWPLLVQFLDEMKSPSDVYVICVFYGDCKPTNIHDYLKNLITDLQEMQNGYKFLERTYFLKVSCFICEAPARLFLKCIISHNGHSGCECCTQYGRYLNCMTFPENNAALRTDEDFVRQTDSDYHKSVSPFTALNIGMVTQFVLDPVHLLYLGVMRKLLYLWLKGPLSVRIGSNRKSLI